MNDATTTETATEVTIEATEGTGGGSGRTALLLGEDGPVL